MNVIYVHMNSISERIPLPIDIDVENKGCALFEIRGEVSPCITQPLFLCVDFIAESVVGEKMMPILRRIVVESPNKKKKDQCGKDGKGRIDHVFDKMLWLTCTRSPVKEFRIYISDAQGNQAPFLHCELDCTLVLIPHLK